MLNSTGFNIEMFKKFPAARRVLIYMVLSYIALVLVNNSSIEFENMWLIYTPMFIAVYLFSRWLDQRIGTKGEVSNSASKAEVDPMSTRGFGD